MRPDQRDAGENQRGAGETAGESLALHVCRSAARAAPLRRVILRAAIERQQRAGVGEIFLRHLHADAADREGVEPVEVAEGFILHPSLHPAGAEPHPQQVRVVCVEICRDGHHVRGTFPETRVRRKRRLP